LQYCFIHYANSAYFIMSRAGFAAEAHSLPAPKPLPFQNTKKLSANTLCGSDVQDIVNRIMASQAKNEGGLMYLWCHALPADLRARVSQAQDALFCVAGQVDVLIQECTDGPALTLRFSVPPALARLDHPPYAIVTSTSSCSSSSGCYVEDPIDLEGPGANHTSEGQQPLAAVEALQAFEPFSVVLDPGDADKWVQAEPSPMYRAVNAQAGLVGGN